MKKLISLALTLAILATLAIGVSAASEYPTWYPHMVGTHGLTASDKNNSYKDGVELDDFASNNPTVDVNITVSAGAVQSRYAVDIEYELMDFSITGSNLVWDVNQLKYVPVASDGTAPLSDKTFGVTIKNYSDQPVYLTAAVSDTLDDGITVATVASSEDTDTTAIPISKHPIASAVNNNNQPRTFGFGVNVHSGDWVAAANKYAGILTTPDATETIATCTITVAATAN